MQTELPSEFERLDDLIRERRASVKATGRWSAPFAIHMLLVCIEARDLWSLEYWQSRIRRKKAYNRDIDPSLFAWVYSDAAKVGTWMKEIEMRASRTA